MGFFLITLLINLACFHGFLSSLTRRSNSEPYDYLDSRGKLTSKRRHVRPLLRPDSFDSDEERRQIMNQDRGPMHSGE